MSSARCRAVRLFRAAMRSAKRCPHPRHAAEVASYVRLKYAECSSTPPNYDAGEEELARLEYFHEVRDSKASGKPPPTFESVLSALRQRLHEPVVQRAKEQAPLPQGSMNTDIQLPQIAEVRQVPSAPAAGHDQSLAKFCPACGTSFRARARFCTECGGPRE